MKKVMYCLCGTAYNSGNKLAKHLHIHGCQSAYASLEDAERARNIPKKKAKTSPSPAPTQVKKPSPVQLLDSSDEESQDHLEPVTDTSKQRTQSKSEKAATVGVMKTSVKSSRAQKLLMDLLEESGRTEDVKKKGPIPRAGERRERHRSEGGARPGGKPERRFLEEEARLLDGYKTVKKRSNKIMSKDISTSIHFEGIKPKIPGKTKGVAWKQQACACPV